MPLFFPPRLRTMIFLLPSFSTDYAIIFVFLFTGYCAYRLLTTTRPHFPPGPKPAPFIGNLLQFSAEHSELLLQQWASKFGSCSLFLFLMPLTHSKIGDLIYLHILGHPMIVLSSLDIVRDLLDKRSSIYSDRPRFVLFSELYVRSFTKF